MGTSPASPPTARKLAADGAGWNLDRVFALGGLESARLLVHLAELFVLADRAGLLRDPDLAADRMRCVLAVAGIA